MRILIVGSGAMGSLFAGKLKQNGVDVTIFNRLNDHVKAIQKDGLTIVDIDGNSSNIKFPIITNPNELTREYDLILVLIKTFATEIVLKNLLPSIHSNAPILTLQNGIGNKETIHKLTSENEVFVGGTWAGASIDKAGVILHRAWGTTFIGSDQLDKHNDLLYKIATIFSKSGLKTEVSANVEAIIWSKLLVNIAYNGLTAVTRLRNGDTILTDEGKILLEKLVDEAVQIAKVKRIPLLYSDPVTECIRIGETEISMNISSMLSDILNQRKTEIEAINGAIAKEGQRYGIPTPYNDMILNLVKVIENSYSKIVR
ncbi:ketopantoate reductase family protein [Oceanobacillus polygoni]|uniref:2-dehydropantoate 2-reductase n=1 Tax=Oceanobacillus polygoni TaxID=1235259 RepID=A0A9X0YQF8_9BACI|nr:ketopantoate reductase family protein [Oceanobacillus polygoni]MBP2077168.1 2-dehydropantoate 2-reductase [Oceanobacillus polygoni]